MVVGPHPLSNPTNWAPFCCQWLLRRIAGTANISGSLSEAGGRIGRKIWTTVQFRISHLNHRPHFFSTPLGFGPETRLHGVPPTHSEGNPWTPNILGKNNLQLVGASARPVLSAGAARASAQSSSSYAAASSTGRSISKPSKSRACQHQQRPWLDRLGSTESVAFRRHIWTSAGVLDWAQTKQITKSTPNCTQLLK